MAEFGVCEFCKRVAVVKIGGHSACSDHLEDARLATMLDREGGQ